ncbi:hypothetical protein [Roseivirga sp. 4D4]|uniref:hypothetical protein n=1 Tax=Roseivirga sp. 4D4 TaxID=1889784 RepID=UPI001112F87C|nr:hypothetical protein [Roseivirga sp. 4D4]
MKLTLLFLITFLVVSSALAQDQSDFDGTFTTRYMRTANKGSLADFSGAVSYGFLKYEKGLNDWLTFGGQVNGLIHYGLDNITKRDAQTGSGPIFEANLWHPNYLDGRVEGTLSQLYADLNFGNHRITIGRFLQQTPIVNPEPWPFPNAMQGLWYKYDNERFKFQFGYIDRIAPRFTGRFDNIGGTIGLAATGVNTGGSPSRYPGNVNSDYLLISNLNFKLNNQIEIDIWNYYADNVFNTFLIEPTLKLQNALTLKGMFMLQTRVGDGGNVNPILAYVRGGTNGVYLGLRAEKKYDNHSFQFNVSVIGLDGRLQLPREWGLEPFYTFQRRTRVEGLSNVTALMAKWTRNWSNEKRDLRFFTSLGGHITPAPEEFNKNKLGLPPHMHLDASIKYSPKAGSFKGLSAELYLAKRFSVGNEIVFENYRINRIDFFHSDLILAYTF